MATAIFGSKRKSILTIEQREPFPDLGTAALDELKRETSFPSETRWTWSCRAIEAATDWKVLSCKATAVPKAGDLALVRVKSLGNHTRIMLSFNERVRLYEGDLLVGVFGNRYAVIADRTKRTSHEELQ